MTFSGSENWHEAIKQAGKVDPERATPMLIVRNRSTAFESFLIAIAKSTQSFWLKKEFKVAQREMDAKKRTRYWASRLFEPTKFYFDRVIFVDTMSIGESKIDYKDLKAEFEVIPVGLDIWTTIGGMDDSKSLDWSKTMLLFIPSKEMVKAIGKKNIPIAFAMASGVKMTGDEEISSDNETRHIEL